MKPLLYVACLLLIASSALSQDSTIAFQRVHRTVIKFAPLSLLDQDATVQGSLEYRTGLRTSVQGEFGYGRKGLSPFNTDLNEFVNAEVWRGRAEVRFYTGRYRTNRRQGIAVRSDFPLGNYWAIDGLFKQINVLKQENLYNADLSALVGSRRVPISRYVLGSHLKIGRQFAFYDPYKRIFSRTLIDIYIGAGMRWVMNDVPPLAPQPVYACGCVKTLGSGLGRLFSTSDSKLAPSLTAGLKLGFAL